MRKPEFIAISGSLRKGSYNTMVLKALQELAPDDIEIKQLSIAEIPLYNFDLHDKTIPPPVVELCNAIKAADGFIIVTPEYNYSVPGVLKNTLDFISRYPGKPLDKKPVGILGASTGIFGTVRAQSHLRTILTAVNAQVLIQPEIMITNASAKFNADGKLDDPDTKKIITSFIKALAELSSTLKADRTVTLEKP